MKTEEIKPGDILYDEDRKMLVKVARVDEDEVVKYSAYTDMKRIFKTVPPPYRVGTRTADVYIHATDEQRKYMERNLAVCEYVNLPNNNRIETLAYIIADLKAENVELEQRVHQLVDEYNDVVRLMNGNEERNGKSTSKQSLGDMKQMSEQFDHLIRKSGELERFAKAIHTFVEDKNLYMKKGASCWYKQVSTVVCSTSCLECVSCMGVIEGVGVICEKRLKEAGVVFPSDE